MARLSVAQRRKILRARALDYMGSKCQICGYQRCMASLHFHHPDPTAKEFTVSSRLTSWDRIQRELDKCVLLCANCHGEVHDGMHPTYLDPDGAWSGIDISYEDDELEAL
jgi:hypothetical protein